MLNLLQNLEDNPKYKQWKLVFETIFETADWINELLDYEPLFITKTVEELTWGYEDPLLSLVHELDPSLLPMANFSMKVRFKMIHNNNLMLSIIVKVQSLLQQHNLYWYGI